MGCGRASGRPVGSSSRFPSSFSCKQSGSRRRDSAMMEARISRDHSRPSQPHAGGSPFGLPGGCISALGSRKLFLREPLVAVHLFWD